MKGEELIMFVWTKTWDVLFLKQKRKMNKGIFCSSDFVGDVHINVGACGRVTLCALRLSYNKIWT